MGSICTINEGASSVGSVPYVDFLNSVCGARRTRCTRWPLWPLSAGLGRLGGHHGLDGICLEVGDVVAG